MSQNHRDLESVVKKLVREHFELEEKLEKIVWIKSNKPEIRLIEINAETIPPGTFNHFIFRHPTKSPTI